MSQDLKLTIMLQQNGRNIDGFPLIRRIAVDELAQFAYEHANDGDTTTFTTIPTSKIDEIQALLIRSDQAVTLRFDAQSDAGVTINAGGLILILDADIDAGASTNATVNNNSGNTANITGLAGGT